MGEIHGVNKIKAKLAGGRTATYYYHRASGTKLPGEYGSPEFIAALAEAQKAPADRDSGTLAGLIRGFQRTPAWSKLADSTKKEYRRVFKFWEDKWGKVPRKLVTIPCTETLKATLDALPKKGALILTTVTGRAFTKKRLNELWTETMVAAGLDPKALHFHDLRGTAITLLFEAGCTVAEAASISGHTLRTAQAILDKYLARTPALARSAIIKLENRMKPERAKRPAKGYGPDGAK